MFGRKGSSTRFLALAIGLLGTVRPNADKINMKESLLSGVAMIFLTLTLGLSSANAAIPGLTVVQNTTPWNSTGKAISVACPIGTVPTGTGYDIGGSLNQGKIYVTTTIQAGSRSVLVEAVEAEGGFSGNWTLTAKAICAQPLLGLIRVSATTNSWSATTADAEAFCPFGTVLVGTGAEVLNGGNDVMLTAIEPTSNSVRVAAQEDESGTGALWSVRAHAFCADETLSGQQVITSTIIGPLDNKTVSPDCPAGKGILGVGGAIENNGVGADISLSELNPVIYQGDHWAYIKAEETAGTMINAWAWTLRGSVICADL